MKANLLLLFGLAVLLSGAVWRSATPLSNEKEDVLYMLEEEKLARDVYLALEQKWGSTIFNHISGAEQTHMDLVLTLAMNLNLDIPASVKYDEKGVFKNKDLQSLYNELITTGNQSLVNALKVGGKIEETDIRDLQVALLNTKNELSISVYERLNSASENHLRAFTRNLKMQGVDYDPIILPKGDFDKIISESNSKPKGNNGACVNKPGNTGKAKQYGKCCTGSN